MGKTIYLHIGLYKTASTFLQKELFPKMQDNDIKVFTPGNGAELFVNTYRSLVNGTSSRNESKELIDETLNKISQKKVLISSEAFFGHQSNGFVDIEKRFDSLEYLFDKPKYLLFYRKQFDILYSGWHQGLKKGFRISFDEYINSDLTEVQHVTPVNFRQVTSYKAYDYKKILMPYIKLLTCARQDGTIPRIMLLPYEELRADRNSFLKKVTGFISEQPNQSHIIKNTIHNKSNRYHEIDLLAYQTFSKAHIYILKVLYFCFRHARLFNKCDRSGLHYTIISNPLSVTYLSFLDRMVFKTLLNVKIKKLYKSISAQRDTIENYYKDKNKSFAEDIEENLASYGYY